MYSVCIMWRTLTLDRFSFFQYKLEPRTVPEPRIKNDTRSKNQEWCRNQEPIDGTGIKNQEQVVLGTTGCIYIYI